MKVTVPSGVPSFLLVSQNVGYLESAIRDLSEGANSSRCAREASKCLKRNDVEPSSFLENSANYYDAMKFVLSIFVHELRSWIFRRSYELYREKRKRSSSESLSELHERKECSEAEEEDCLVDVVVIHFQEIGGQTSYMPLLKGLEELLVSELLPESGWCSGLLVDSLTGFTALGTIIFVSKRVCPITSMLSIPHEVYVALEDDPCTYGGSSFNLYRAARFSGAGSSRKGFLLTSLRVGARVVSFCNCHLYHDESNEDAVAQTPSKYYTQREKGFLELISECLKVINKEDPFFIFGDFNTRLDGKSLLEYVSRVHQIQVVVSPKAITSPPLFWNLFRAGEKTVHLQRLFDIEPQLLVDIVEEQAQLHLGEMPVGFYPTFKYLASTPECCSPTLCTPESEKKAKEERNHGCTSCSHRVHEEGSRSSVSGIVFRKEFSKSRIPAWCDRVLFNAAAATQLILAPSDFPATILDKLHLLSKEKREHDTSSDPNSSFRLGDARPFFYNSFSLSFTDHNGVYLLF